VQANPIYHAMSSPLLLDMLQHILGIMSLPPDSNSDGCSFSSSSDEPRPIAGTSRLAMLSDEDRIPFSAKGKWRADNGLISVDSGENEDEDSQTAAQLEADAALAAALQAEEDGIEARRFSGGIVIQ
jgi:hypothetical protein